MREEGKAEKSGGRLAHVRATERDTYKNKTGVAAAAASMHLEVVAAFVVSTEHHTDIENLHNAIVVMGVLG